MRPDEVLVIVLAGGVGERLAPLTRERAKPAVYFGGPYRIIDFVLSNCINSGLRRVYIATQYKSLSLNRHIRQGWSIVSEELGEFIEILPPQKRVGEHWYQGTADAVYQNLYSIVREESRYVVVLAGDHVYKMDYLKMVHFHQERDATVTLAAIEVPVEEGHRFGILAVDDTDRVTGFAEKPTEPPAMPGHPELALASMGIYVFNSDVLIRALEADAADPDSKHDFGRNIIPSLIPGGRMYAYPFYDENKKAAKYWRDIGTLDAFYDANMDLCGVSPEFNLYDPEWPLRTYMPPAPPAKFVFGETWRRGEAIDSLISHGCIVSGSHVEGSILCPNVRVHSFCHIDASILMPGVRVGRHARLRRAIIDRDVHIPRGARIGYDPDEDKRRHTVSEGGVVVVAPGEVPLIGPIDDEALRLESEADRRG
ncbi:MAG: glucose-1-phosphate adenylyltransferase [Acidobacteriota bacterium]|nr:glucose-1-phosphate adenylyltransferase [Acidobacteriota bacterium]